jgi:GntR family transcriptional regulator, transcriptional repressor for pyruvate dehydrogenase complex
MAHVIRAITVTEQVADAIEHRIRAGDFSPGERLPSERELCEEFDVSRVAVRGAMARLKTDGFIVTRQGTSATVSLWPGRVSFRLPVAQDLERSDWVHLFEIRLAVEVLAAQLAAEHRRVGDLTRMREALEAMSRAVAMLSDGSEADDQFHHAIGAASQNPHLTRLVEYLRHQFGVTRRESWSARAHAKGHPRKAQLEHERLLRAIEQRSVAAAGRLAASHITSTAVRLDLIRAGKSSVKR